MDAFADSGNALNFGTRNPQKTSAESQANKNLTEMDYANETDANSVFMNEWQMFKSFWDRALSIYQPIEISIIALGLLGNVLGLLTLVRSRRMNSSPSFVYHRVLVGADLIFCITYFLHLILKESLSVSCHTTFYRYWAGAYFAGTLTPAINHICGYLIMYMTLVITLDRFLAFLLFERYRRWNTMQVAYTVTCISFFLSAFLHCWAYFVQGTVVEYRLNEKFDESKSIVSKPCWAEPVVYHWIKRDNISRLFSNSLKAKDYYNGAVRVGYPLCLCMLTLAVLISFAKRQKKRRNDSSGTDTTLIMETGIDAQPAHIFKRSTTSGSTASQRAHTSQRKSSTGTTRSDGSVFGSFVFGFVFGATNGAALSQQHHRVVDRLVSPSMRHRQRCERALFYLMIAVILLAFLQVASSESRRILHLIFPPDELFKLKVLPAHVPMQERVWNFRFLLYGHQATRILANFCTAIDRSFICFLYIAMNNLFRRELVALLKQTCCLLCIHFCPQRVPVLLHGRDNANRRLRSIQAERRASAPPVPPPSPMPPTPSPMASPASTIPVATERGYANRRHLGENLALLENATP